MKPILLPPPVNHPFAARAAAPLRAALASGPLPPALPAIPPLPSTLLGLELLLQHTAFDLTSGLHLLYEDPAAILHLFAFTAEDFPDDPDEQARPIRLSDRLAAISPQRFLQALASARSTAAAHRQLLELTRFAAHAAAVGRCAETVAQTLGLPAGQAHLVGLLHELGQLPAILGCPTADPALLNRQLARRYKLPTSLRLALGDVHTARNPSVWTAVIAAAHDLLRPALTEL